MLAFSKASQMRSRYVKSSVHLLGFAMLLPPGARSGKAVGREVVFSPAAGSLCFHVTKRLVTMLLLFCCCSPAYGLDVFGEHTFNIFQPICRVQTHTVGSIL